MNRHLKTYAMSTGGIVGSHFNVEDTGPVLAVGVLSHKQICRKHNLTSEQYREMETRLVGMKLCDSLFSFPQGPYYDILLHRVAHSH
jgi:hypothetical protein